MTEQVAKNIYRIPVGIPNNPLKELNSYLIRDPERSILIDTGFRMEPCRRDLLAGLKELDCDPASVDIVLTHLHGDHSGLAPDIIGPGRSIYISETELPMVADEAAIRANWVTTGQVFLAAGMPRTIVEGMVTTNPAITFAPRTDCTQYAPLRDGDVISAGGYHLRCLLTPGHTPGHICLWDAEHRLMFTGDHVLFDITPNITAWVGVEDSLGNYLDSLRAVRGLPVETALPGHRKTGSFTQRVDELLAHHQVRVAEAERIVAENPGLTPYEITSRMTWSIRAKNWDDFPDAQKFFAVGECLSHLDYLRLRGRVRSEEQNGLTRYYPA